MRAERLVDALGDETDVVAVCVDVLELSVRGLSGPLAQRGRFNSIERDRRDEREADDILHCLDLEDKLDRE